MRLRSLHTLPARARARTLSSHAHGLFGVPYLRAPADFSRAAAAAVAVCRPLVAAVSAAAGAPRDAHVAGAVAGARGTLTRLDALSDTICKVLDAAEATRNVSTSTAWRAAADGAFNDLGAFMFALNSHTPLHAALLRIARDARVVSELTPEQRRMTALLLREFERDGVGRPDASRATIVELNSTIATHTAAFSAAQAHREPVAFTLPVEYVAALGPLPPHVRAALPQGTDSDRGVLVAEQHLVAYTLRGVAHEGVRAAVFTASHRNGQSSVPTLEALRASRARLAAATGFASFADLVAADRMAGSAAAAIAFTRSLTRALLPLAAADYADVALAKAAAATRSGAVMPPPPPTRDDGEGVLLPATASVVARLRHAICVSAGVSHVAPWDWQFYSSQLTAMRHGSAAAEAAQYLPLSAVLLGIGNIMRRVFGVTLVQVPLAPGESWVEGSDATSLLLKYVLQHEVDGALGTLFLDPFSRPAKFPGAAHFVIQCGKRMSELDGALNAVMMSDAVAPPVDVGAQPAGEHVFQLPIVALVTNFSPPPSRGGEDPPPSPSQLLSRVLLTPQELETLFHEVGHALHSLLSRTEFQHLSGTRGPLDFVETPAHLFEYWAREYASVSAFATHHVTGAPMPRDLWERVLASRAQFRASELLETGVHALFDQALFASDAGLAEVMRGPCVGDADVTAIAQVALSRASARRTRGSTAALLPMAPPGYWEGDALVIPLPHNTSSDTMLRPHVVGVVDMLHGEGVGVGSPPPSSSPPIPSGILLECVVERYSCVPPLQGSAWAGTFGHVGTYGGGYYAYLYASAFAAALWAKLFKRDPFSRGAGEHLRRELLCHGAGKDAREMLHAALAWGGEGGASTGGGGSGSGSATNTEDEPLSLTPLLKELTSTTSL